MFKKHHDDIENFRQDKPEVYKLLKHILENDACVTKAQADAAEIKVYTSYDLVKFYSKGKAQLLEMNIKLGPFSKANCGEDSEESRIVKAWNQLMKEVNPVDKTQLLRELDDLMSKQWPCNIVGCYLSQHLEVPRHPLKVFEVLTSSVLYVRGDFSESEDKVIMDHIESQNDGKYDLVHLKAQLNRPRTNIYERIERTLLKPYPKRGQKFTTDEDVAIFQHVLGRNLPGNSDELKKRIGDEKQSWKDLVPALQRRSQDIGIRWDHFIHPTLLAHLSGTMNLEWRRPFFQWVIDNKWISVTDIDWTVAQEKWPSVPKRKLTKSAIGFSTYHGKKDVALYKNLEENMHLMRSPPVPQEKWDLIDAYDKLRVAK